MVTYLFTYLSISQNETSAIANNQQLQPRLFGTTSRNFWNQFGSVKEKLSADLSFCDRFPLLNLDDESLSGSLSLLLVLLPTVLQEK